MVLGPHSDDIELGMAITLKRMIEAGAEVFYRVIATHPQAPHRVKEAENAAAKIGVNISDPLHFNANGIVPDGQFRDPRNVNIIRNYISRLNQIICPHIIFVNFAPSEGVGEYHPDHLTLCRIVQELAPNHPGLMYYPVMAYTTGNEMNSFHFLVPLSGGDGMEGEQVKMDNGKSDFELRMEIVRCFQSQSGDVYFGEEHQRAFLQFGLGRLHGITMAERFMASTLSPIVLGLP